ncbi:fimbria/pilus periplasmic chaperone [Lysobacter sp. UC]|uniref:Fimbria/pilus periplasmic chaperone n=2 Tax=Lysobacter arvi TaxID=3038776 RepID=A0ABU1CGF0_9GAMM|nr:fimbria/pilus periplasmic chaperone [Lysobacter arvi]
MAAAVLAPAHADIQISGTRVIYPADEPEVTVQVENYGRGPRLLQVWTDGGDVTETAATSTAPFLVTPPMSRLEPGKGQALRLMFTGADVPQDRESVYWLNVLEVPPRPKGQGGSDNFLQFAVRTRIKIFYRPEGLRGAPMDSIGQLTWRLVHAGAAATLECTNPTAYNVSFAEVRPERAARETMPKGGMCPAMGRATFPVQGQPGAGPGTVLLTAINDYGGFVESRAPYSD